jgi:hypothetical protein
MPPQERKRRWWRIVLVLGIAMVREAAEVPPLVFGELSSVHNSPQVPVSSQLWALNADFANIS